MAATPKPTAQGDLRKSPLVHVLASLHRKAASGTLVVWPESGQGGQDRILFASGLPVAARPFDRRHGSLLGLLEALADRAAGAYAFFAEDLVGEGAVTGALEPASLFHAMVHATRRSDGLERVLASRGESLLRVKRGLTPRSLGLDREEAEVLDVMRAAPTSASELITRSGRPEVARRLLYLLELTLGLEILDADAPAPQPSPSATSSGPRPGTERSQATGDAARSPSDPRVTRPVSSPAMSAVTYPEMPAGLGEADATRWGEIVTRARAEDAQTFYQVLDVAQAASTHEIELAFVRMAKLTHPDRLGPALAPLRPHADRLFRRATEGREVLVDPKARAAYDAQISEGGGTPAAERHIRQVVEAALDYQKVDLLLRKRAFGGALAILDRNIELSPEVADYPAKKAYAIMLERGVDDRAAREEILALVDRALALDERHEGAHFTKGQLLKKMGDPRGALTHFRAAVEANPHNIDAAREVRLATMKKSSEAGDESLLGRLFKKKS
jgi:curved DNA-binding protein CbpA